MDPLDRAHWLASLNRNRPENHEAKDLVFQDANTEKIVGVLCNQHHHEVRNEIDVVWNETIELPPCY
jgi:hypothetical protein